MPKNLAVASLNNRTVALTTSGHTVVGDAGLLTVTDSAGANTLIGGSGGLTATVTGIGDAVSTAIGASDMIDVETRNYIISRGNDLLTINGWHSYVTAFGAATINAGSGGNIFFLNGAETLNTAGLMAARIGSTGNATIAATGAVSNVTVASGGRLDFSQGGSSVDISGGGATINAAAAVGGSVHIATAANQSASITLGTGNATVASSGADVIHTGTGQATIVEGGGAEAVTFGAGQASVLGGSGVDTYVFNAGSAGGTATIATFKVGTDQLTFAGYSGSAVANTSFSGGTTMITLVDGTRIAATSTDGSQIAVGPTGTGSAPPPSGQILTVGVGMEFAHLADALRIAQDGDVIKVLAGTYVNDFSTVNAKVTIEGVGGMVNEVATVPPPNGKGLILSNNDLTIKNFSFSGVLDGAYGNVAGIRYQAGNLNVQYCNFEHNDDGILATPNVLYTGTIRIDHSEFGYNGAGDGYSHNIYIGPVASAVITNSYFHDANIGHEVKCRAGNTLISGNVISDGATGTASYSIDLPNAGSAVISDNVILKGPNASNPVIIHYGGETQYTYAANSLSVTGNTIVNEYDPNVVIGVANGATITGVDVTPVISGNQIYGLPSDRIAWGAASISGNTMLTSAPTVSTASPWVGAPVIAEPTGAQTLALVSSGNTVGGGSSLLTITDSAGNNTITGGSGGISITATGEQEVINTAAGSSNTIDVVARSHVVSAGADAIRFVGDYTDVVATGAASITAGTGFGTIALDGKGLLNTSGIDLVTIGGAADATVNATGSYITLSKSSGGNVAFSEAAGTNATATIGGGAATIGGTSGASGGVLITTSASDPSSIRLGTGNTTVASGGADTIWAGSGVAVINATGAAQVIGGANAAVVSSGAAGIRFTAGSGNATLNGGAGNDAFVAGSGSAVINTGSGADSVTFGSGAATVTGGSGPDLFTFNAHSGGGNDLVYNFNQSVDGLAFTGFSGAPVTSNVSSGGSTLLTLADGTHVQFVGVAHLTV